MITIEELYMKKEMLIKEKIFLEAKMQVVDEFILMEQQKVEKCDDFLKNEQPISIDNVSQNMENQNSTDESY